MKGFTSWFLIVGAFAEALNGNAQGRPGAKGGGARGGDARPAATLSAVTHDLPKYEGFYGFYYDEKTGKVLLEIDKWKTEFLYYTYLPEGIGNGGAERGQASAVIAKFIKVGPKIFLLQPNYGYRAVQGSANEKK